MGMKNLILIILVLFPFDSFVVLSSQEKGDERPELQAVELIVNGNFSSGNSGFSTDYRYESGGGFGIGAYTVTDNPQKFHPGFAPCGDHTQDGAKLMMIIDSYTEPNKVVWSQTVQVDKKTPYIFSMWATKLVYYDDSYLQIIINGRVLDKTFRVSKTSCTWSYFEVTWCSEDDSYANIKIVNLTTDSKGNDLAFDDLSLKKSSVCDEDFIIDKGADVSTCPHELVKLGENYSRNPDYSYSWNPGTYLNDFKIRNPLCLPDSSIEYIVTIKDVKNCCIMYDTIMVNVFKTKKPAITANPEYLCNNHITLSASTGFVSYKWSNGMTGRQIVIQNPGVYKVTVTDINGCETDTTITIQSIKQLIEIPGSIDLGELCIGNLISGNVFYIKNMTNEPFTVDSLEFISGREYFELINENPYKIILPNSQYGFKILMKSNKIGKFSGKIRVKIRGKCSREATILVEASIIDLNIDLQDSFYICSNQGSKIGIEENNPKLEFSWIPEVFLDNPNTNNPVCTPTANMKYFVTIKHKDNGCIIFDTVDVFILNPAKINISADYDYLCKDTVKLTSSDGFIDYEWSTGETSQSIKVTKNGKYTVTAIDTNGCSVSASVDVFLKTNNVNITASEKELCKNPVILTASDGFEEYQWSTGENTKTIEVKEPGEYSVTAIDSNGCISNFTFKIGEYVFDIVIPDTINLVKICLGNTNDKSIYYIENFSSDTFLIDSLVFVSGSEFFEVEFIDHNRTILPNSKFPFKIKLTNLKVGQLKGLIKLIISSPCDKIAFINVIADVFSFDIGFSNKFSVCSGKSINIGHEDFNPDYDYQWIPIDFLDEPNSNNPLCTPDSNMKYIIKVTDKINGCIAFDTVEVFLYDSKVSITASSQNVCQDPVILTASDGFIDYNWSTGENDKIIKVMKPGKYSVTAIDSNGCISDYEIEIGAYQVDLVLPDQINLGDVCIGSDYSQSSLISNIQNEKIVIDSIYIENDSGFHIIIPETNDSTLLMGDSFPFSVKSKFNKVGFQEAFLIVKVKYPCDAEFKIKLTVNTLENKLHIFIPDTTAVIGAKICLPVYAYAECPGSYFPANYGMSVSINKTLFKPDSIANGSIISIRLEGQRYIFEFEDRSDSIIIITETKIINYICGTALLGEFKTDSLHIDEIDFDNIIEILKQNGSITIDNCGFEIRHIRKFKSTKLKVDIHSSNNILINTASSEEGTFVLKVFDLTGNEIMKHTWQKQNKSYEEFILNIDTVKLPTGFYFIILQSPWHINTEKIMFIK